MKIEVEEKKGEAKREKIWEENGAVDEIRKYNERNEDWREKKEREIRKECGKWWRQKKVLGKLLFDRLRNLRNY